MPYILNNENFIHGKNFGPGGVFVGYIFLAVGAIAIFTNPLIALLPIAVGIYFVFTVLGTEVDFENKRVREYVRVFWQKHGTWEPLDHFPDMAILRKRLNYTMRSYYSNQSITNTEQVYDVCLLTPNHRERITLCRYPTVEQAREAAEEWAKKLDCEYTSYNPEVSAASRRRR